MMGFFRGLGTLLLCAATGLAGDPPRQEHATLDGTISVPVPGAADGWDSRFPADSGDLLFPDGVMLLSMRQAREGGAMVTVSLDQNHRVTPEEQAAFLDLARERAASGRMEVWEIGPWQWIVQEFRSPSERVLTAQAFAGPYALAYVFWLDASASAREQDALARSILEQWGPSWEPREDADASGAEGRGD